MGYQACHAENSRAWSAVGLVLLLGGMLISGCGSTAAHPATDQPPNLTDTVRTTGVQIDRRQLVFSGRTTLPDGACIQTQLYADEEPAQWWPSETCADLRAGEWQIAAPLGKAGAPDKLDESTQYALHAWASADPTIKAEPFYFDLAGPPP